MDKQALLAMAERAECIGRNLASRAFSDPMQWDRDALADSANGFTVGAALRALAAREGGG